MLQHLFKPILFFKRGGGLLVKDGISHEFRKYNNRLKAAKMFLDIYFAQSKHLQGNSDWYVYNNRFCSPERYPTLLLWSYDIAII